MYRTTTSVLIIVVIFAIAATLFAWNAGDGLKTYENTVHGYSLSYPSTMDVREYGDENAVIGTIRPESVEGVAEARIVNVLSEPGQTLQDAVAQQLQNLCAADGPTASFSCIDMLSVEPFTTEYGEQGFVLLLKGELKNLETGSVSEIPMGPYYILTLSTSATMSKVLDIQPPLNKNASEADRDTVRAIAESVRLTIK